MMQLIEVIARASNYLDELIEAEGPAHLRRIRVNKIHEEAGEVEEALNGVEGSNPRKGVTHTTEELMDELLDVMLTGALAYYHVSRQNPITAFEKHTRDKASRYYGIE